MTTRHSPTLEQWIERTRAIAVESGLDPDKALQMTVIDFMRFVTDARESRRTNLAEEHASIRANLNIAKQHTRQAIKRLAK